MNEFLDPSTISQEWQADAHIDETLLDESSMKIPSLHSKYLDCLAMIRYQLRQLERKKKSIHAAERRSQGHRRSPRENHLQHQ